MESFTNLLGWLLIIIGGILLITSAIGCIRFPDFLSKLHAAGVGDSCGGPLIMLGLIFQHGLSIFSAKLLLLTLLLLITNPTACHTLAKAALSIQAKQNKDG